MLSPTAKPPPRQTYWTKYAPDEIGAGDRGKTVDSDEWDYFKLIWINVHRKKTRKFGPPPPYAPIVCRRFEPLFWFEIITISDKLYKWSVIATKSLYTNEKQYLSPFLYTTLLYELPPTFKRKSWASPFYNLYEGVNTTAPQSNFALTSPTSIQLSWV